MIMVSTSRSCFGSFGSISGLIGSPLYVRQTVPFSASKARMIAMQRWSQLPNRQARTLFGRGGKRVNDPLVPVKVRRVLTGGDLF
jgi:hypothetical protein